MQVLVTPSTGAAFAVEVEPSQTVEQLQSTIEVNGGFQADEQRLVHNGIQLEKAHNLSDYAIERGSNIHVLFRLCAGGKKRKKKVYTTPKKIKHKRKKVKLAVLKYYKVDGDGKIERLRRECPQPECGAGVFMASMENRQYCGHCHLTYVFDDKK